MASETTDISIADVTVSMTIFDGRYCSFRIVFPSYSYEPTGCKVSGFPLGVRTREAATELPGVANRDMPIDDWLNTFLSLPHDKAADFPLDPSHGEWHRSGEMFKMYFSWQTSSDGYGCGVDMGSFELTATYQQMLDAREAICRLLEGAFKKHRV